MKMSNNRCILITGGCKNGKSTHACLIADELARNGPLYYVATMIPHDEEDHERIRYHVKKREGMRFETLEIPFDIGSCLDVADPRGTFLIDSVTALLLNEMFPKEHNGASDPDAVKRCMEGFDRLISEAAHVIFVSDYIYSDACIYDGFTENYRRSLAELDKYLAKHCDKTIEICSGRAGYFGSNRDNDLSSRSMKERIDKMQLVIGGYYQGKLAFAKERFSLREEDVFIFDEYLTEADPDTNDDSLFEKMFSYPCIYGVENYVKRCVIRGMDPVRILKENREKWKDSVMICTDIFCGVVQIDPVMRAWREQTGHVCAYLASEADSVTRMFCGLPQKLK